MACGCALELTLSGLGLYEAVDRVRTASLVVHFWAVVAVHVDAVIARGARHK